MLHADMDAFYASVEQRDHPELRGRPVIVGASEPRGVVAAASYEARAFGVRSAMPGFRARELCPQAAFLPSDMPRYLAVSREVHEVFGEFTSDIEPIALDEAFLDISGSVRLFGGPLELARRLKRRVRERTRLAVSVGVAPVKLVAKIACTLGKPDGLLLVPPEAVRWLLDPLPVRRIWGVGPVLDATLERYGIRTIRQLADYDPYALERVVGSRARAFALIGLARGEDPRVVESARAPRSYGEESTFEHDVTDRGLVTAALTAHAEAVARRLRHDRYRGRTITLKIKLGQRVGGRAARLPGEDDEPRYPLLSRSRTLERATDDGALIRQVAIDLWDRAGVSEPVRLLGVSLSSLEAGEGEQLELFAPRVKAARLGPALDAIRARFGRDAIGRAVTDPGKMTPSLHKKRGDE
ncbi:MAG: DNA polymerase IV [Polyangiaceae bacterium]|nr:DNA polymerase IV [Polyangiaceae bacterium]